MKTTPPVQPRPGWPNWFYLPVMPAVWCKELRAVLLPWLFLLVTPSFLLLRWGQDAVFEAYVVYGLGCLALGAAVLGHELVSRTLSILLAQPVERAQVWSQKMVVLGVALGTGALCPALLLLAATEGDSFLIQSWASHPCARAGWLLGPLVSALCVAPWLTLVTRSALASVVFSVFFPCVLWQGSGLFDWLVRTGYARLNVSPGHWVLDLQAISFALLLLAYWFLGWLQGRWVFRHMDVIEGEARDLSTAAWAKSGLGTWFSTMPVGRVSAVRQILMKELHLQQVSFLIAALYVGSWLTMLALWWLKPTAMMEIFAPTTILYVIVSALCVGASSFAEERGLGTWEWQLTLPVSAWRQWCIKTAAALCVGVTLAAGLASLLLASTPASFGLGWQDLGSPWTLACLAIAMVALAMHASSLVCGTVKGILVSVPIGIGLISIVQACFESAWDENREGLLTAWTHALPLNPRAFCWVFFSGLGVMLWLWFGYHNYRRLGSVRQRLCWQCVALAIFAMTAGFVSAVLI